MQVPGLKGKLRRYQKDGVRFIEEHAGRCLIADEMGLGKTVQALAWLQLHPELRPAVVVCPGSLKVNWKREARKWMTEKRIRVLGGFNAHPVKDRGIYIINYDVLLYWTIFLTEMRVVILDESQYIKNAKAQRTKAALDLCRKKEHIICLSGTPVVNRPVEFWTTLSLLNPKEWNSYFKYSQRYCGLNMKAGRLDYTGATNLKEFHERLVHSIMLRRQKVDVLKELPPKTRVVLPVHLENNKEYRRAERSVIEWLRRQGLHKAAKRASRAQGLTRLSYLKQLCIKGKMKAAFEWIDNYLDTGEKLVAFCTHRQTVELLQQRYGGRCVSITGGSTDRQESVDALQTNPTVSLLTATIKAAGVGFTMTAAKAVLFLELGWTAAEHDQAEDRIHRIGQKDAVMVYYMVAEGTIEEDIATLLDKKRETLGTIMQGELFEDTSIMNPGEKAAQQKGHWLMAV